MKSQKNLISRILILAAMVTLFLIPAGMKDAMAGSCIYPDGTDAKNACTSDADCRQDVGPDSTCKGAAGGDGAGAGANLPKANGGDGDCTKQQLSGGSGDVCSAYADRKGNACKDNPDPTKIPPPCVPEMSDYLAGAFLLIAGSMVMYFRRKVVVRA